MDVFDIECFISEVETRPVIWDYKSEIYSDKEKRNQAWNELCMKFVTNFDEKNLQEKNIAATHLQRKWKSLRDCFKREHTKQIKTDAGSSNRKPYKYYEKLLFLTKLTESDSEINSIVQEDKDSMDLPLFENSKQKKQKICEEEIQNNFPEPFIATQSEVEEAEWNFALSLLPHLKEIPHEYKLDAQMEILMVLKKYKRCRRVQ